MHPVAENLVLTHVPLAKATAGRMFASLWNFYSRDELEAECLYALVAAGNRWMDYCEERNYDPNRADYFGAYAKKRMRGAVKDMQRKHDPYSRSERTTIKATPPTAPYAFPAKGDVLMHEKQWEAVTERTASSESTPEEQSDWNAIASAAVEAYLTLPPQHRLLLAYSQLKPPRPVMAYYIQGISVSALKVVLSAALEAIDSTAKLPYISTKLATATEHHLTEVEVFLVSSGHTPSTLIQTFIFNLENDPGTLVDMAKRLARASKSEESKIAKKDRDLTDPSADIYNDNNSI